MREYQVDYSRYSFKAEDDWGDYDNGKPREGYFDKEGYCCHSYFCNDGKFHTFFEHIAKWEYFNGRIPEGLKVDHIIPVKKGGTNNMSNLRIGTQKFNMNNEHTKKQMSESAIGKHINRPDKSIEVYKYTKNKQLLSIYPSANEAARQNNADVANISACCNGRRKTHKGCIWSHFPL